MLHMPLPAELVIKSVVLQSRKLRAPTERSTILTGLMKEIAI